MSRYEDIRQRQMFLLICLFFLSQSSFDEQFEDTKRVFRIRKSKKNRQQSGEKKKNKQQSTNIHIKTKDRETRTPLKVGGELGCSGRVCSSCATSCTHRVNIVCQWLLTGWWFSPVSSLNKTDRHDITVILLKVVLNTISLAFRIYILMKFIY